MAAPGVGAGTAAAIRAPTPHSTAGARPGRLLEELQRLDADVTKRAHQRNPFRARYTEYLKTPFEAGETAGSDVGSLGDTVRRRALGCRLRSELVAAQVRHLLKDSQRAIVASGHNTQGASSHESRAENGASGEAQRAADFPASLHVEEGASIDWGSIDITAVVRVLSSHPSRHKAAVIPCHPPSTTADKVNVDRLLFSAATPLECYLEQHLASLTPATTRLAASAGDLAAFQRQLARLVTPFTLDMLGEEGESDEGNAQSSEEPCASSSPVHDAVEPSHEGPLGCSGSSPGTPPPQRDADNTDPQRRLLRTVVSARQQSQAQAASGAASLVRSPSPTSMKYSCSSSPILDHGWDEVVPPAHVGEHTIAAPAHPKRARQRKRGTRSCTDAPQADTLLTLDALRAPDSDAQALKPNSNSSVKRRRSTRNHYFNTFDDALCGPCSPTRPAGHLSPWCPLPPDLWQSNPDMSVIMPDLTRLQVASLLPVAPHAARREGCKGIPSPSVMSHCSAPRGAVAASLQSPGSTRVEVVHALNQPGERQAGTAVVGVSSDIDVDADMGLADSDLDLDLDADLDAGLDDEILHHQVAQDVDGDESMDWDVDLSSDEEPPPSRAPASTVPRARGGSPEPRWGGAKRSVRESRATSPPRQDKRRRRRFNDLTFSATGDDGGVRASELPAMSTVLEWLAANPDVQAVVGGALDSSLVSRVSVARLATAFLKQHQVSATLSQLSNLVMVALVFFVQLHNHSPGCAHPLTLTRGDGGDALLAARHTT